MKTKTLYPLTITQIKKFKASSRDQEVSIDIAYLGPVPRWILVAFVKNNPFVVFASTYPFHFHYYNVTKLVLFENGFQNLSEPLTMDCSSTFAVTRVYETIFSSTGVYYDDRAHMSSQTISTY